MSGGPLAGILIAAFVILPRRSVPDKRQNEE